MTKKQQQNFLSKMFSLKKGDVSWKVISGIVAGGGAVSIEGLTVASWFLDRTMSIAAKFEQQDPNKFNWGGAVMYFRNKANKMGVDMPPELMGRVQGKPKAIPKPNEQVEDWARENQVSKKVISEYVNQRAALERQLDEAKRGLAGLAPIEAKIMPMLKEVKGQQMKVKNLILKYAKTPITTMDYEKAFSMALEKVAQDERDFVRGYILGQLNKGDIEKMLLEKKQSKEAGLGSWLAGIVAKVMNWLSSYRRNVAMLEKAVD